MNHNSYYCLVCYVCISIYIYLRLGQTEISCNHPKHSSNDLFHLCNYPSLFLYCSWYAILSLEYPNSIIGYLILISYRIIIITLTGQYSQPTYWYIYILIIGERVVTRLRRTLFDSIIIQEVAFFDETKTGELINRLASDCVS